MDPEAIRRRLRAETERRGDEVRVLLIGDWSIRISGLDGLLAEALDRRWGGFVSADAGPDPLIDLRTYRSDAGWLEQGKRGEVYRVESATGSGAPLVWSYNFAAVHDGREDVWRAAVSDSPGEPTDRTVENLTRYLIARAAVERGGFALHGAGLLREGRAYLFGGRSRSGKSTVVALSEDATSLGDDFAIALPCAEGGWVAPAVPFDNSERAPADPVRGWLPLAGIWRLHQADRSRVELPPSFLGAASLIACVAFAWAMQDRAEAILRQVERFVTTGRYYHLHFDKSGDFWRRIDRNPEPV